MSGQNAQTYAAHQTRDRIESARTILHTTFTTDEIVATLAEVAAAELELEQALELGNAAYLAMRARHGEKRLDDWYPAEYQPLIATFASTNWPSFDGNPGGGETWPVRKWQKEARAMRRKTAAILKGIAQVPAEVHEMESVDA